MTYRTQIAFLLIPTLLVSMACTRVNFESRTDLPGTGLGEGQPSDPGASAPPVPGTQPGTGTPIGSDTPVPPGPDGKPPENIGTPSALEGIYDFASAVNRNFVWVAANKDGGVNVYKIELDAQNGYPTKQWRINGVAATGNRTYVSSIGLLVGKEGGSVYRIDDSMPQTQALSPIWTPTGVKGGTRSCLTSFDHNGTSYIGIAWEKSNNDRVFTRIPIDVNKPDKIDVSRATEVVIGNGDSWSYGCFTDSSRGYFWGAWGSGKIYGVDVRNMIPLDVAAHAPNRGHSNTTLGTRFVDPVVGQGSYALGGDGRGNLLTGKNMYTYTHDSRYDLTYGSMRSAGTITVAKGECFSSATTCEGKVEEINTSTIGQLGPLSSMNDGRVVGIVRGSVSQVYVLSPVDPNDLTKKLNATRIKEVDGNAYMYSDFTGGTLAARDFTLVVELDKLKGFKPNTVVDKLSFIWTAQAGGAAPWTGLKLLARCYKAGAAVPAEVEVTPIKNSGEKTDITVPSCQKQVVDRLELHVVPLSSSAFTRTAQIKVFGVQ